INPLRYSYIGIYGWPGVQSILLNRFDVNLTLPMTRTGYSPMAGPASNANAVSFAASAATRAAYHHQIAHDANVSFNLAYLRRLALACRAAGTRLVLFTTPVTSDYASAFGEASWRPWRLDLEAFSREFGVPYRDYSRDTRFDWRDFSDADHMNVRGAAKLGWMLSGLSFWMGWPPFPVPIARRAISVVLLSVACAASGVARLTLGVHRGLDAEYFETSRSVGTPVLRDIDSEISTARVTANWLG